MISLAGFARNAFELFHVGLVARRANNLQVANGGRVLSTLIVLDEELGRAEWSYRGKKAKEKLMRAA